MTLHFRYYEMKKLLSILLLGSTTLACSDYAKAPLGPDGTIEQGTSTTTTTTTVQVLQRLTPLDTDISMSAKIGRYGGVIELPTPGIRVIFPEGAVSKPTMITVTARAGSNVAYTFKPHGLVFKVPVKVQQDAKVTEAWKSETIDNNLANSRGAYFESTTLSGSSADVSEFRPTEYDLNGSKFHWTIEHFSGYLLSIP